MCLHLWILQNLTHYLAADNHDERHKMITNSKEENSAPSKQTRAACSSSSFAAAATPWLRLKDPRIVRVSRAFGGKDRHSKVCTIRGLRDRRVRLSVSTAIQLYDLQDRLGLNQPSKVVDWLLNAAKDEIDELPPLPIPSSSLGLHYQSMLLSSPHQSHLHRSEFKINCNNNVTDDKAEDDAGQKQQQKSSKSSNPSHPSSFSTLLNNLSTAPPFGYHNWEPSSSSSSTSNLPLFFTSHPDDDQDHHHLHLHNFNNNVNLSLPSPLSLSTGSQFLEFNHQLHQNFFINNSLPPPSNLHSINQPGIRPFHFSMAPKFVSQQKNNNGDQTNKDDGFGSDRWRLIGLKCKSKGNIWISHSITTISSYLSFWLLLVLILIFFSFFCYCFVWWSYIHCCLGYWIELSRVGSIIMFSPFFSFWEYGNIAVVGVTLNISCLEKDFWCLSMKRIISIFLQYNKSRMKDRTSNLKRRESISITVELINSARWGALYICFIGL